VFKNAHLMQWSQDDESEGTCFSGNIVFATCSDAVSVESFAIRAGQE
jgi:hypothetical protein